mmetsp:Transcript_33787/g.99561  ORF Transcript_33787/g.99561 Transcript_33787/m.99561 type:complete len:263 (-) Transcript_33787:387-1175(-)
MAGSTPARFKSSRRMSMAKPAPPPRTAPPIAEAMASAWICSGVDLAGLAGTAFFLGLSSPPPPPPPKGLGKPTLGSSSLGISILGTFGGAGDLACAFFSSSSSPPKVKVVLLLFSASVGAFLGGSGAFFGGLGGSGLSPAILSPSVVPSASSSACSSASSASLTTSAALAAISAALLRSSFCSSSLFSDMRRGMAVPAVGTERAAAASRYWTVAMPFRPGPAPLKASAPPRRTAPTASSTADLEMLRGLICCCIDIPNNFDI